MALVEYRDHVPEENTFVTRKHDFTSSVGEMKHWLEEADAIGGGDIPEAVADALYDGLNLNWRNDSTKICVLISDGMLLRYFFNIIFQLSRFFKAPPHGLSNSGDSFGEGCPAGHDPIEIVREMAKNNITLYSVGCEPAITPYKDFFMTIAYITGGQYIPLRNANLLSKVIIGSAQEQISLDRLMQDVENEVLNETQSRGGDVDVIEMSRIVQEKLEARGVMSKQLLMNDEKLEGPSENTIKYSKMSNMKELKDNFKIIQQEYTYYGYEKAPDMMIKPACLDESLLEVRTCAYERPIYVESKKLDYISVNFLNIKLIN